MGSRAKTYCVLGAGSVTGMFCVRELLQRGGNVRACMRDPDKYKAEIEELVTYFPRGQRGLLEFAAADVTQPQTLTAALQGCEAVLFLASGSAWSGEGAGHDVDFKGVENCAQAALACGVKKMVLVSCFMVSDRQRFSLTRFFMNVGPKWRMMDHKWRGECALRRSGLPYSIVRAGALWLTPDGSGGSSGVAYVVSASQGTRPERGRIAKSDLAAVCASCALDLDAAANATFDLCQVEPPVVRPHADDGTRWHGLRRLKSDAELPVEHLPWFGLLGLETSAPALAPQLQPQEGEGASEERGGAEEQAPAAVEAVDAAQSDAAAAAG